MNKSRLKLRSQIPNLRFSNFKPIDGPETNRRKYPLNQTQQSTFIQQSEHPTSLINNYSKYKIVQPNNKKCSFRKQNKSHLNAPFATESERTTHSINLHEPNILKDKSNIRTKQISDTLKTENANIFSTIVQTEFGSLLLPIRPISQNRIQPSLFPKRVSKFQEITKEHQKILSKLTAMVNKITETSIPTFQQQLHEKVETHMNDLFSTQLQNNLSSLFEKNSNFESIIDHSENNMNRDYSSIKNAIDNYNTSIRQFLNSIDSFSNDNMIQSTHDEVTRLNEKISLTISNSLTKIENDEILKTASSIHLNDKFTRIIKSIDNDFETLQNTQDTVNNSMYTNLLAKIENVSQKEINQQSFIQLPSAINSIDSSFFSSKESIDQINSALKETTEIFDHKLKESIETVSKENCERIDQISRKIDDEIGNTQKSLEIFRNEIIDTIQTIQKSSIKAKNELYQKIENEITVINKNSDDVQKKFDNFASLIENECNYQLSAFFDFQSSNRFIKFHPNELLNHEKVSFTSPLFQISKIEFQIEKLEADLESAKSSCKSEIDHATQKLDLASEKLNELQNDFFQNPENSFIMIENFLSGIENKIFMGKNFAFKAEIKALETVSNDLAHEKAKMITQALQKMRLLVHD